MWRLNTESPQNYCGVLLLYKCNVKVQRLLHHTRVLNLANQEENGSISLSFLHPKQQPTDWEITVRLLARDQKLRYVILERCSSVVPRVACLLDKGCISRVFACRYLSIQHFLSRSDGTYISFHRIIVLPVQNELS